jgi:hypothetical protein
MAAADAKVVLLAIPLAEQILAQKTNVIDAVALNVHAETYAGRNVDHGAAIGCIREPVKPYSFRLVWDWICPLHTRIAHDCSVIGQWCYGSYPTIRISCLTQPVEPSRWYKSVTVEQHYVTTSVVTHANISGTGKTSVFGLKS